MMAPVPLPANGRCGFGEGTFGGTHGNARDAPIPDLHTLTPERASFEPKRPFAQDFCAAPWLAVVGCTRIAFDCFCKLTRYPVVFKIRIQKMPC